MADKLKMEHKQYPLAVFLTYMYELPYPVCAFLKQHNLYEGFLTDIVKIPFNGIILKRILMISLIKVLEVE